MTSNTKRWVHGLLAAFVGGLASAMDSGLALMVLVPEKFNLGPGLGRTLLTVSVLGILTGAKVAFAYLKQSPLPTDSVEVTETKTTKVEVSPSPDK